MGRPCRRPPSGHVRLSLRLMLLRGTGLGTCFALAMRCSPVVTSTVRLPGWTSGLCQRATRYPSPHALARRCLVLTQAMLLPVYSRLRSGIGCSADDVSSCSGLRVRYAMPGPDMACDGTRCAFVWEVSDTASFRISCSMAGTDFAYAASSSAKLEAESSGSRQALALLPRAFLCA
eukprot:1466739-Rhodomonas_salina.1